MLSTFSRSFSSFDKGKVEKLIGEVVSEHPDGLLDEHEVYSIIGDLGFSIASHAYADKKTDPAEVVARVNAEKLVAKGVVRYRKDNLLVTHKTDIGALQFNIPRTAEGVQDAIRVFEERFNENTPYRLEGTLFVEQMKMSGDFGTELLVSGYQDPFFGPTVCYGLGGTIVEYLKKVMLPNHAQIFMPALFHSANYKKILEELPASQLAEGLVRGTKKHLDHSIVEPTLRNVQDLISDFSQFNKNAKYIIDEIEVNPTVALQGKLWALDGVMRVSPRGSLPYYDTRTCGKPLDRIECLTNPKSVTVAGGSTKNPGNPGSVIIKQAEDAGIKEIYALHPSAKNMFGAPAFKDLKEIVDYRGGKKFDLLSICVPAQAAGKLMTRALDLNCCKAIQVVSGGFGETEHGAKMQQQLHDKLFSMSNDRPVVNGPNTVGNLKIGGINTVFVDRRRSNSDGKTGATNCALLCQSGAFMLSRVSDIAPAVNPAIAMSVGNQLDLSVTDFLEHYVDLPEITTYGLYMEGLSEGEGIRLMNLVAHARELGKSVIIYKAGRSQAGIRAAKGHTAAMAGDFGMFKELLEDAGAIVVDSTEEWNQLVMLTTQYPQIVKNAAKKSLGIGVLTNAGFEKCACADHLMVNGTEDIIHLPKWSKQSLKIINEVFKKQKITEVVDVSEVLDVTPIFTDIGYYELLHGILQDDECDIGIIAGVPETQSMKTQDYDLPDPNGIFQLTRKLREEYPNKPLIAVVESGARYQPLRHAFQSVGVAVFNSIDAASKAIVAIAKAANRGK